MLAVHVTPPCGMVRLEVPLEDAHRLQLPLVVQVALNLKPEALTVHPERVGVGLIAEQTGCPEAEDCALKCATDEVQVTVAVPSLMVTLVDVAVAAPVGVIASACAMYVPSPSTAASAGTTRKA